MEGIRFSNGSTQTLRPRRAHASAATDVPLLDVGPSTIGAPLRDTEVRGGDGLIEQTGCKSDDASTFFLCFRGGLRWSRACSQRLATWHGHDRCEHQFWNTCHDKTLL